MEGSGGISVGERNHVPQGPPREEEHRFGTRVILKEGDGWWGCVWGEGRGRPGLHVAAPTQHIHTVSDVASVNLDAQTTNINMIYDGFVGISTSLSPTKHATLAIVSMYFVAASTYKS